MNKFIVALCALCMFVSASVFASDKKKGPELQTPYYFGYDVEMNDSCCFDVTVTAPAEATDGGHDFQIVVNGDTDNPAVPFSQGFTYGESVSFVVCPGATGGLFTLDLDIYCGGNGHPNGGLITGNEPGEEDYVDYNVTFDMSDCCGCPDDKSSWIVFQMIDPSSVPTCLGCPIRVIYNIPQEIIDCYDAFSLTGPEESGIGQPISNLPATQDYCVPMDNYPYSMPIRVVGITFSGTNKPLCQSFVALPTCGFRIPQLPDFCKDTCEQDEFTLDSVSTKVPSCSSPTDSCRVKVWYGSRNACGRQEVQIIKIQTLTWDAAGYNCEGCPEELLFKHALAQVLGENKMNFEPNEPNGDCDTTWSVGFASKCFAKWEIYNPYTQKLETDYIPCDGDCCMTPMEVCYNGDGTKTFNSLLPPEVDGLCPDATPPGPPFFPGNLVCEGVCQWSEFTNWNYTEEIEGPLGKSGSENAEQYGYIENSNRLEIGYNQSNENITVKVTYHGDSDFEFYVADINGNVLLHETGILNNGQNNFVYPLYNLPSGTYFYGFANNGVLLQSSKFTVVK